MAAPLPPTVRHPPPVATGAHSETPDWSQRTSVPTSPVGDAGELSSLGDYELDEVLGRGGMGVVYRGRRRGDGRAVAVKTLRRDLLATPGLIERFRRETRAAGLAHPYVMPLLDTGEWEGMPFLVMPLARNGLATRMREFRSPRAAAGLMAKVARGVDAAHRAGILHRDLKPGNILFDAADSPLVADFGLAKLVDELDTLSLTNTGAILGTPAYMAPEQALGARHEIGPPADVWSLGVILYELLTGHRPFEGGSREQTLDLVRKSDPRPPRSWRPEVDCGLDAIVLTCLAKDPARRFASAGGLADDLDAWAGGGRIAARRMGGLLNCFRRPAGTRHGGRTALAMAALFGFIVVGFLAASSRDGIGPDWNSAVATDAKRRWLENEIHSGRAVDLVPANRPPRWHRWGLGNPGSGRLSMTPAGAVVESAGIDVLELTPMAPRSYRLDAVIRVLALGEGIQPGCGLVALHTEGRIANRAHEAFLYLRVDGGSRRPGQTSGEFGLRLEAFAGTAPTHQAYARTPAFVDPLPTTHTLSLEIGPTCRAAIDGKPLRDVARPKVARDLEFFQVARGVPPTMTYLNPEGGVGLLIDRGRVEIRSVTLTPSND
jgi:serine/threonine-protein kinase